METPTTIHYTKLTLRKLRGDYQRALTAEQRAIKRDVPIEKAWWFAANSDFYLSRLRLAEAGLPLPAPRTSKSKALGGLKCLAMIGRVIKKAFQFKALQAKAALLRAAKLARRALRNSLKTVARLVMAALPTPKKEEIDMYSLNLVIVEGVRNTFWCLQADGGLYTVQSGVAKHRRTVTVNPMAKVHDYASGTVAAEFETLDLAVLAIEDAKLRHSMGDYAWHIVPVGI